MSSKTPTTAQRPTTLLYDFLQGWRVGCGGQRALIADGNHAHADSYVSLAVIASAIVVALGVPIGDPLIGLAITVVILRITRQSWRTVRGHDHPH